MYDGEQPYEILSGFEQSKKEFMYFLVNPVTLRAKSVVQVLKRRLPRFAVTVPQRRAGCLLSVLAKTASRA